MRNFAAFAFLLLACLMTAAQSSSDAFVVAKTESAILLDKSAGGISYTMTEDAYQKLLAQILAQAPNPNFIRIKRQPKRLTADARFGFNLVVNRKNIGWILDGNETRGFVLYADWNADGDLTNDGNIKFKKIGDSYLYRTILVETVDNQKRKYPFDLKLEIAEIVPPGKTEKQLVLKIYDAAMRRGTLNFDNRQMAFALYGSGGKYNDVYNNLYFDLNGDGKFDTKNQFSPEIYKVSDKYVNVGGKSYQFTVDRYGDNLTLKPLAEKMPDRADLSLGNSAPEFSFKNLDGKSFKLSDFRGRVVLLDFWGLWCAPCVAEAPNLAAAYKKYKEKGFEIISLDKGDTIENLRKFTALKQMNWTHTQSDEALEQLYRVDRHPTYFLLDKEGKIISNTLRPGDEMYKKVEALLEN